MTDEELPPQPRRKNVAKVYESPNGGTITIRFPEIVTMLLALQQHHQTDSISELIPVLQGICLAEGVRPYWKRWTSAEQAEFQREARRAAATQRLKDGRERYQAEQREKKAFAQRVKEARDKLGDY